jgi:hypothetical protein
MMTRRAKKRESQVDGKQFFSFKKKIALLRVPPAKAKGKWATPA